MGETGTWTQSRVGAILCGRNPAWAESRAHQKFYMLDNQLTAKICIPKIIFNICDASKKRSDEVFLYITADVQHAKNVRHHNMYANCNDRAQCRR